MINEQLEIVDKDNNELSDEDKRTKQLLKEELLSIQVYLKSGFGDLKSYENSGRVLITKQSKLVAGLLVEDKN